VLMRATLILDSVPRDGAHQMATDLALMHRATAERSIYLRLYRWEPHCLSFGAHEPALRRYDRAAIDRLGIDTVRRPTGGRAVWHARELTYAVTAADGAYGTLRHAYLRIHEALARAVAALGAAPVLAPPTATAALGSGACFASAAGGEVTVDGAKVIGSAQLRSGGGMLQHGSLLLEDDQHLVQQLSGGAPDGGAPLARLLGRVITWEEAAEAVIAHAAPHLAADWTLADATPSDLDITAELARFRDPLWTWRR